MHFPTILLKAVNQAQNSNCFPTARFALSSQHAPIQFASELFSLQRVNVYIDIGNLLHIPSYFNCILLYTGSHHLFARDNKMNYSEGFFDTVSPNFESLVKSITTEIIRPSSIGKSVTTENAKPLHSDTAITITKKYFPPNGAFSDKVKQAIRDECIKKQMKGEYSFSPTLHAAEPDVLVEVELKNRKTLRKDARLFAVERIHSHYRAAFQEMMKGSVILNSVDEIIAWIDGQFRVGDKESVLTIVGHIIYTYFKNIPRWDVIEEVEFMKRNNIVYAISKGKGCIAKCINNEKAEQNKRFQNVCDKYGMNLSSRIGKAENGPRKRPGSGDFFVTNEKVNLKKQKMSDSDSIRYVLISHKDFIDKKLNIETVATTQAENVASGCGEDVDDVHHTGFAKTVMTLLGKKLAYLAKPTVSNTIRFFWLAKLLQSISEAPDEDHPTTDDKCTMIDDESKVSLNLQGKLSSSVDTTSNLKDILHSLEVDSDTDGDDVKALFTDPGNEHRRTAASLMESISVESSKKKSSLSSSVSMEEMAFQNTELLTLLKNKNKRIEVKKTGATSVENFSEQIRRDQKKCEDRVSAEDLLKWSEAQSLDSRVREISGIDAADGNVTQTLGNHVSI